MPCSLQPCCHAATAADAMGAAASSPQAAAAAAASMPPPPQQQQQQQPDAAAAGAATLDVAVRHAADGHHHTAAGSSTSQLAAVELIDGGCDGEEADDGPPPLLAPDNESRPAAGNGHMRSSDGGSAPRMPQQHECPPSGHATPPKAAAAQRHADGGSIKMGSSDQPEAFGHAAATDAGASTNGEADGELAPAAGLTDALLSPPPRPPLLAPPASSASSPPARQLQAVLLSTSPRLLVIDNFLPPELCQGLMDLAQPKLVRSRVASGSETPSRTSSGTFFVRESAKAPVVLAAESLIEQLFASPAVRGPFGPLSKVEAMQVVHYRTGAYYHDHYDNRADGPLTRVATILVYLCDTPAGGATSFSQAVTQGVSPPQAELPPRVTLGPGGRGVKVFPVQGRALVFWSTLPNGDEDANSLHAAETVLAGEKWIASRWLGCAGS